MRDIISIDGAILLVHIVLSIIGATGNVTLLLAVRKKTPIYLKAYSILIFCGSLADLTTNCFDFFIMQRMIPISGNLVYLSSGPCRLISPNICYLAYCYFLSILVFSLLVMTTSFAYRYYILSHETPAQTQLLLLVLALLLPCLVQGSTFLLEHADSDFLVNFALEHYPIILKSDNAYTGHYSIFAPLVLYTIIYAVCSPAPCYAVIICTRIKALQLLNSRSLHMSEKTRNVHKSLIQALTYHAMLPCTYLFAIIPFILMCLDIVHHPLLESAVFMAAAIPPTFNCYFTLYFVKPYRSFVSQSLNQEKKTITVSNVTPSTS